MSSSKQATLSIAIITWAFSFPAHFGCMNPETGRNLKNKIPYIIGNLTRIIIKLNFLKVLNMTSDNSNYILARFSTLLARDLSIPSVGS